MKERQIWGQQRGFWAAAGLVCIAALGAIAGGTRYHVARQEAELRELRAKVQVNQGRERELAAIVAANAPLRERVAVGRGFTVNGPVTRAVIAAVTAAKHPRDWITRIADAHSYFLPDNADMDTLLPPPRAPGSTADAVGGTNDFRQIVVEGYTPEKDFWTVQAMIKELLGNPLIESADLLGDDMVAAETKKDNRWRSTGCHLFALQIKVRKLP